MNKVDEFISEIKDCYKEVRSNCMQNPVSCAGSIRTTLEIAVKLFWFKKYDKEPVWIVNGKEEFNLCEAVKDKKFSSFFNEIIISDIHMIRKMCNNVLHNQEALTLGDAGELMDRLEKCIRAMEKVLELKVIDPVNTEIVKEKRNVQNTDKPIVKQIVVAPPKTSVEQEREIFWKMFDRAVDENGNPFVCKHKEHYATINQNSANSSLCLGLDFLVQKGFFRVGIYIADDSKTQHFKKLLAQKEEIESKLGFSPIWNAGGITQGQKNIDTRRIEVQIPFVAYDHNEYGCLIDKILPIIMKFIDVFSVYFPEAIKKNYQQGEESMVHYMTVSNSSINNPLRRNKKYGTRAQAIYDECCEVFNWDRKKRYLFGLQQILYAEKATPEEYSPWFLPNNNWTKTEGGNWFNEIYDDTIEEMWVNANYGLYHDDTIRVTFAKDKSKEYVFVGLYQPVEVREKILEKDIIKKDKIMKRQGDKVWIKIYKRISDKYPQ